MLYGWSMGTRPHLRVGACYDFRNPPGSPLSWPQLYGAVLDQIAWLDELGYDLVWFTEHHFVDDGYLPSWIPVAGAVAGRTSNIRISSDITLMPFQEPLRLAEDLAVLDNISHGRMEIGVGMGYALHEFHGFNIPRPQRVSRTEEGVEILQRAFTGERFSFEGKRFTYNDVRVTPTPVQEGGPPIWMAAMGRPGAERAARLGLHLLPQGAQPIKCSSHGGRQPGRMGLIHQPDESALSARGSSPMIATEIGHRFVPPSDTKPESTRTGSPTLATMCRSNSPEALIRFHKRGWSATKTKCLTTCVSSSRPTASPM